jgi:hypothetical protein
MADWIPWTKGLPRKPEVMQIARVLKITRYEAACRCMAVWEWADENTVDGTVAGLVAADLDEPAGIAGFGAAMAKTGWLQVDDTGVIFPNWTRWNARSAKERDQARVRMRRLRTQA